MKRSDRKLFGIPKQHRNKPCGSDKRINTNMLVEAEDNRFALEIPSDDILPKKYISGYYKEKE